MEYGLIIFFITFFRKLFCKISKGNLKDRNSRKKNFLYVIVYLCWGELYTYFLFDSLRAILLGGIKPLSPSKANWRGKTFPRTYKLNTNSVHNRYKITSTISPSHIEFCRKPNTSPPHTKRPTGDQTCLLLTQTRISTTIGLETYW